MKLGVCSVRCVQALHVIRKLYPTNGNYCCKRARMIPYQWLLSRILGVFRGLQVFSWLESHGWRCSGAGSSTPSWFCIDVAPLTTAAAMGTNAVVSKITLCATMLSFAAPVYYAHMFNMDTENTGKQTATRREGVAFLQQHRCS